MVAGTSSVRTSVASTMTATARPTPSCLMAQHLAGGEAGEDDDDEGRGGRDDAARPLEPDGDREVVVAGVVVHLLDPREQEDLVVHGEAEGEDQDQDGIQRSSAPTESNRRDRTRCPSWKIHPGRRSSRRG